MTAGCVPRIPVSGRSGGMELCLVFFFEVLDGRFVLERDPDIIKPLQKTLFDRSIDIEMKNDVLLRRVQQRMQRHGLVCQMKGRFKARLLMNGLKDPLDFVRREFDR